MVRVLSRTEPMKSRRRSERSIAVPSSVAPGIATIGHPCCMPRFLRGIAGCTPRVRAGSVPGWTSRHFRAAMTEESSSGSHRTGSTDPTTSRAGLHGHCCHDLMHYCVLFQRNHRERRTALPLYGPETAHSGQRAHRTRPAPGTP